MTIMLQPDQFHRDFLMSDTRGLTASRIRTPPPSPPGRVNLRVREITESDREAVARLLAKGFQRPVWYYAEALRRMSRHPRPPDLPKYGLIMEADGVVVGAVLLIFSTLRSGGNAHTRCNVTSWYVEPEYKPYAAVFTSRALRHKD